CGGAAGFCGFADARLVARPGFVPGRGAAGLVVVSFGPMLFKSAFTSMPTRVASSTSTGLGGGGALLATLVSVTSAFTSMRWPHLRHFMRTVLPATFSSAIWYLALHCSQRNLIAPRRARSRYTITRDRAGAV